MLFKLDVHSVLGDTAPSLHLREILFGLVWGVLGGLLRHLLLLILLLGLLELLRVLLLVVLRRRHLLLVGWLLLVELGLHLLLVLLLGDIVLLLRGEAALVLELWFVNGVIGERRQFTRIFDGVLLSLGVTLAYLVLKLFCSLSLQQFFI